MQANKDSFGFYKIDLKPSDEFKRLQITRLEKWIRMWKKYDKVYKSEKFKKRVRKGIPQTMRIQIWPKLAEIQKYKEIYSNINYYDLLNQKIKIDLKTQFNTINDDVPRTFQNNINFDNKIGQQKLQNVLKAFLIAFPDIGYTQGLNSIAGIFLLHFDEETSFWMIVSFMIKCDRQQIYKNLQNLDKELFIFEKLLVLYFPVIQKKLDILQISLTAICTGWLITNYAHYLPFISVLNIFDIFLNEPEKILYRIGLAIFKIRIDKLNKSKNLEQIMYCFKDMDTDSQMLPENLIEQAFTFTFSRELIKSFAKDYVIYKKQQDEIKQKKLEQYKLKLEEIRKKKDTASVGNINTLTTINQKQNHSLSESIQQKNQIQSRLKNNGEQQQNNNDQLQQIKSEQQQNNGDQQKQINGKQQINAEQQQQQNINDIKHQINSEQQQIKSEQQQINSVQIQQINGKQKINTELQQNHNDQQQQNDNDQQYNGVQQQQINGVQQKQINGEQQKQINDQQQISLKQSIQQIQQNDDEQKIKKQESCIQINQKDMQQITQLKDNEQLKQFQQDKQQINQIQNEQFKESESQLKLIENKLHQITIQQVQQQNSQEISYLNTENKNDRKNSLEISQLNTEQKQDRKNSKEIQQKNEQNYQQFQEYVSMLSIPQELKTFEKINPI